MDSYRNYNFYPSQFKLKQKRRSGKTRLKDKKMLYL